MRDVPFDLPTIAERLARLPRAADPPAGSPRAAVAAILRDGDAGAELLLIRRAEREGDPWSGHMAFPGGRWHADDESLVATAVRETREEVGIDLAASGALLARLPDLEAIARARRTGLVIAPFVFTLSGESSIAAAHGEVAEALWTPLGPLARGEGAGTIDWEVDGRTLTLPCLHVGEHVVWGLTYRMLETLFEALLAER